MFIGAVILVVLDVLYPRQDLRINNLYDNQTVLDVVNVNGTRSYQSSCPYVVGYVKDISNQTTPYRVADFAQVDSVGTWSLHMNLKQVIGSTAEIVVGVTPYPPKPIGVSQAEIPELGYVLSRYVTVMHQIGPLPAE